MHVHANEHLVGAFAEQQRVDVELYRPLVLVGRTWAAVAKASLQRSLARLAVSEEDQPARVRSRLARLGKLLEVAADVRDALLGEGERRPLERVARDLELLEGNEIADGEL